MGITAYLIFGFKCNLVLYKIVDIDDGKIDNDI